jgi:hypothetical protein
MDILNWLENFGPPLQLGVSVITEARDMIIIGKLELKF